MCILLSSDIELDRTQNTLRRIQNIFEKNLKTLRKEFKTIFYSHNKKFRRKTQIKELLTMPLPETIYIYYGSEMGTGEEFANELGKVLTKEGIKNTVMDIDEFEEEDIVNQELCIFFFSTYGNGMPTRMLVFSKLIL